jgi:hypothetical protein
MCGERTSTASGTERAMAFACTARGLPAWAFGATPRSFFSTRTRAVAGTVSWDASLQGDDPVDSAAYVDRQQLDHGHPEPSQVIDYRGFRQPRVRAANRSGTGGCSLANPLT